VFLFKNIPLFLFKKIKSFGYVYEEGKEKEKGEKSKKEQEEKEKSIKVRKIALRRTIA